YALKPMGEQAVTLVQANVARGRWDPAGRGRVVVLHVLVRLAKNPSSRPEVVRCPLTLLPQNHRRPLRAIAACLPIGKELLWLSAQLSLEPGTYQVFWGHSRGHHIIDFAVLSDPLAPLRMFCQHVVKGRTTSDVLTAQRL